MRDVMLSPVGILYSPGSLSTFCSPVWERIAMPTILAYTFFLQTTTAGAGGAFGKQGGTPDFRWHPIHR